MEYWHQPVLYSQSTLHLPNKPTRWISLPLYKCRGGLGNLRNLLKGTEWRGEAGFTPGVPDLTLHTSNTTHQDISSAWGSAFTVSRGTPRCFWTQTLLIEYSFSDTGRMILRFSPRKKVIVIQLKSHPHRKGITYSCQAKCKNPVLWRLCTACSGVSIEEHLQSFLDYHSPRAKKSYIQF